MALIKVRLHNPLHYFAHGFKGTLALASNNTRTLQNVTRTALKRKKYEPRAPPMRPIRSYFTRVLNSDSGAPHLASYQVKAVLASTTKSTSSPGRCSSKGCTMQRTTWLGSSRVRVRVGVGVRFRARVRVRVRVRARLTVRVRVSFRFGLGLGCSGRPRPWPRRRGARVPRR